MTRDWHRNLWAVRFVDRGEPQFLIGETWRSHFYPARFPGEVSRCLLFRTRAQAREWCRAKQATYSKREDCLKHWRFVAVPVVESVTKRSSRLECASFSRAKSYRERKAVGE